VSAIRHFARCFVGLSTVDSAELLGLLLRHITRLENAVRWSWRDGDIAIWDNRATQHYAVTDYDDRRRLLHPASWSPVTSRSAPAATPAPRVKGDASGYSPVAAARRVPAGRPRVRHGARRSGTPPRPAVSYILD
jgi:taurine dioxygenase